MEGSDGSPPHSLFIVRPSELFPRINMEREDDDLEVPFQTLAGEFVTYLGRTTDGILALSTYRIFKLISTTNAETSVPLGLVEIVQLSEQDHIVIFCKDASSFKCSFKTTEQCSEWQRRIHQAIRTPESLESLFAFPFHVYVCDEINSICEREASIEGGGGGFFGSGGIDYSDEYLERLQRASRENDDFMREVVRLGFDLNGAWRISKANEEFQLCPTYPKKILVPGCVTDEILHEVANYRGSRRLPSVVWRHKRNGAVIARCSQPEVGWLGWRSHSDEQFLKALADACAFDRGEIMRRRLQAAKDRLPATLSSDNSPPTADVEGHEEVSFDEVRKVLIMDARSYASAIGNRARGGGCECIEYYPCAEIKFMCLGNIHVIRKSFHALRSLCATASTDTNWFCLLERTNWFQHLGGLFSATTTLIHAVEKRGCPVLVHCSDGWDRTPQIVATAQLCLDPYYRTVEGFRILVEREWLSFGHKFAHRCGHGPGSDDLNERSPIFIQWLDLVHQLHRQYPCSFEFNMAYLIKLVQHLHSCLFGTFLCNSYRERLEKSIFERTFSVWPFLSGPMYRNPLYIPNRDDVLWPKYNLRDLHLWTEVYMGSLGNQNYNRGSESVQESITSTNVMPNEIVEHQLPNSENNSDREESPDNATGAIPKIREGALRNAENLVSTNDTRDSEGGNNLYKFHTCASALEIDAAGNTYDRQNTLAASENRSIISPNKATEPPTVSITPEKLSTTSDKEELGLSSPYVLVPEESASRDSSNNTTERAERNNAPNSISQKNNGTNNTSNCSKILSKSSSNGSVSSTSSSLNNPNNCNSNSSVATTTDRSYDNKSENRDEIDSEVDGPPGISSTQQRHSDDSVNDGIIISPTHRTLEISPSGRCEAISNRGSSVPATPTDSADNAGRSSNGESNDRQRGAVGAAGGTSDAQRNGRPRLEKRFHLRGVRSLPMTPPAQSERAQMTISCPDGLAHALSEQNLRLQQIVHEHKLREDMLLREIHDMRMILLKKKCPNCKCNQTNTNEEQSSVADNVENASICSWEAVDDRSAPTSSGSSSIQQSQQQTNTASVLWVPDHAVKRCTNCQNEFWIGRRRHHCRSCGQIFCADCSEFWAPLPDAKLFKPVRLCGPCYLAVTTRLEQQSSTTSLIINNMPNYTTSTTISTGTTNTTLVATTVWTTKSAASSSQHLPPELGEPVVANMIDVATTTTITNIPSSHNNNMSIAQIPIATASVFQPERQQQPKQSHPAPTATLTQTPAPTNSATVNLPQPTVVSAIVAVTTTNTSTSTSASSTIFKSSAPITAAADALQQQQQQIHKRQNAAAAAATASATVAVAAAAATNSQIESSSMSHMLMAANKNIAASVAN